ncbi:MAG: hypothetical protein ACE5J2_06655 [Nitrososphaerales archaeon]
MDPEGITYLKRAFDVKDVTSETKVRFVKWYIKFGNRYASLERVAYEANITDRKIHRLFDELVSAKLMEENVDENTRTPVPDTFEHPNLGLIKTPGYRFEDKYFEILKDEGVFKEILRET